MKTIAIGVVFASKNATNRLFPENFLFGVSSAAYQIEGAWNADGKGPSIWDEFLHSNPKNVDDLQNGDIAANSYEYYQDDIDAAKNLKVIFFRSSYGFFPMTSIVSNRIILGQFLSIFDFMEPCFTNW